MQLVGLGRDTWVSGRCMGSGWGRLGRIMGQLPSHALGYTRCCPDAAEQHTPGLLMLLCSTWPCSAAGLYGGPGWVGAAKKEPVPGPGPGQRGPGVDLGVFKKQNLLAFV